MDPTDLSLTGLIQTVPDRILAVVELSQGRPDNYDAIRQWLKTNPKRSGVAAQRIVGEWTRIVNQKVTLRSGLPSVIVATAYDPQTGQIWPAMASVISGDGWIVLTQLTSEETTRVYQVMERSFKKKECQV